MAVAAVMQCRAQWRRWCSAGPCGGGKVKSSKAGASQWKIYYHRMWGQLSTTCSNVLKQPNGELLVAVNHNQVRTMASETVDPIDWSYSPPSWAVPPERLVHSINQCTQRDSNVQPQHVRQPSCLCGHSGWCSVGPCGGGDEVQGPVAAVMQCPVATVMKCRAQWRRWCSPADNRQSRYHLLANYSGWLSSGINQLLVNQ